MKYIAFLLLALIAIPARADDGCPTMDEFMHLLAKRASAEKNLVLVAAHYPDAETSVQDVIEATRYKNDLEAEIEDAAYARQWYCDKK